MRPTFTVLVTGNQLVAEAVDLLKGAGASVAMMSGKVTEPLLLEALESTSPDAVLMRGNPVFGRAALLASSRLRVVAKHGAGVDSVDLDAATALGIPVLVAGEANAPAVAEHTIALILALGRDLVSLDRGVRTGEWARGDYKGRELAGRTLGIVGWGRVGRRVGALARCLGLDVVGLPHHAGTIDPGLAREAPDLETLLAGADIVSLHVPLTPATAGLMSARAFGLMRPGSLLINTGRGGLIDETALAEALVTGTLAGAALDTLAKEPPEPGHFLLQAPNLLLTPHIAAMTEASIARMGVGAAQNIVDVLTGTGPKPANLANPAVLDGGS